MPHFRDYTSNIITLLMKLCMEYDFLWLITILAVLAVGSSRPANTWLSEGKQLLIACDAKINMFIIKDIKLYDTIFAYMCVGYDDV